MLMLMISNFLLFFGYFYLIIIGPICGKRFTASSNLYYHRMTHNKVSDSFLSEKKAIYTVKGQISDTCQV